MKLSTYVWRLLCALQTHWEVLPSNNVLLKTRNKKPTRKSYARLVWLKVGERLKTGVDFEWDGWGAFWVREFHLLYANMIFEWFRVRFFLHHSSQAETRKLRLAGAWKNKKRVEWFSFIVSFVLHTTFDDDDDVVKSSGADNSATSWCWPANVPSSSSRVAQFTSSTLWRRSIIGFDGFFSAFLTERSWRPQNVNCWFFHSSQLAIRSPMHNWIDLNETSDFVYLLFPLRLCFRFFFCVVCLVNSSIHKTQRSLSLWIFFLEQDGRGRRRRLWMLYYERNETIEQEGCEKTMEKREYQSGQSEMS